MNRFNKLAERIRCAMDGRGHDVFVDEETKEVCVMGINVPMLADLRMIAEEVGAIVHVNNSWDCVEVELV